MKLCSFDARSEGQSGDSLERNSVIVQRTEQEAPVWATGTSQRVSGWAGEKVGLLSILHRYGMVPQIRESRISKLLGMLQN